MNEAAQCCGNTNASRGKLYEAIKASKSLPVETASWSVSRPHSTQSRLLRIYNGGWPMPRPTSRSNLRVRIGINAGEPIREGDELHGAVVKSTESIASMGNGGEMLVANVVRELAAGKGYAFVERGEFPLAGIEEPTRIWEMHWAHSAS